MEEFIGIKNLMYTPINEEGCVGEFKELTGVKSVIFDNVIHKEKTKDKPPKMRDYCKYFHYGYDRDHILQPTCRHEKNIPKWCSWGECSKEVCPLLRKNKIKE